MSSPNNLGNIIRTIYFNKKIDRSFLLEKVRLIFIICTFPLLTQAQESITEISNENTPVFDEIPILVMLEGYGNFYLNSLFTSDELLYVDTQELFSNLSIPCVAGKKRESFNGYIVLEEKTYSIDFNKKEIQVGSKKINTHDGLINEMGAIYIESSLLAEAFGITLTFNFRSLMAVLKSDFELPIIKLQRLEKQRNSIRKLQGEIIADTVFGRNYHFFKLGMLDWSLSSVQSSNKSANSSASLSLGTELFFGEANISINYNDAYKFDSRQINYLWKWVDNDRKFIRQAQFGKISNRTISFVNSPIIGAVIRNSPTTVRKAKGYYTINEYTEPNWTVELYINDVLVDYTKADASGLFTFKVPLVYGYTTLKLKIFGPLGEERTEERLINMPYTIMPIKEFEYSLSGGILQDSISSKFGRAEFNYGLNRMITVGGGVEYLSSIPTDPFIPFANITFQPLSSLTVNAEYAYGVRGRALLSYYFWKNAVFQLDYSIYAEDQLATRFNAQQERKAKLSIPFRHKQINGLMKINFSQSVYDAFTFNQADLLVSAYYSRFNSNISTQLNWVGMERPYVSADWSVSYRMRNRFVIRPSTQYNGNENKFSRFKLGLEKSFKAGYFSISYERSLSSNTNLFSFNLIYDLNFARTTFSSSYNEDILTVSESAQGSLGFGSGKNNVQARRTSTVSKGGISIYPFLDLNQNGIFDKNEHIVKLLSVKAKGNKVTFSEKDSIIRISNLNPFTYYMIELDDSDLENIAWRFQKKKYKILVDPNQYKRIDIPVVSVGEVNGMAYMNNNNSMKGIGRILVDFYDKKSNKKVAKTLSEPDGYIYYLGLEPGEYYAKIDSLQLSYLSFTSTPSKIEFKLKSLEDGDIIGGLDFVLNSSDSSTFEIQQVSQDETEVSYSQTVYFNMDSLLATLDEPLFKIQLLALSKPIDYQTYFASLMVKVPELEVEELLGKDGLYHYSTKATFNNLEKAHEMKEVILKNGWKDCFVAIYNEGKRTKSSFVNEIDKLMIKDSLRPQPTDTLYSVQLLALRVPLKESNYFSSLQKAIRGLAIKETLGSDGLFRYTTPYVKGRIQAQNLLKTIKKSGWDDCFISNNRDAKLEKDINYE